ncbi:hypothetical protein ABI_09810 [Asticcacaulis biprosthecium C19]|uniref:Uncharacterized protein n=1 Tax=Asticcacaulis biprosthecium C19 TaxID=715226 RepID=F4QGU2_9CAUL|nr:hypothetical protein [Asticcacaulis biprosthecium]EGF92544.1 hypothetical protein ABI_09810 [Asticcacaulis biprosthecium C19]
MKTIRVVAAALLCSIFASPVLAQAIVDAAPSNLYAVAAGDVATPALAQLNDAADSANAQQKVDLYKQLMEVNGQSRNIRNVVGSTKAATRLIVIERSGQPSLSAEDSARYDSIAGSILGQTEAELIQAIAVSQSASFSAGEIQQLIAANSSVAAAKYNSAKFVQSEANSQQVQAFMVEAVVKIIKTFRESMAS